MSIWWFPWQISANSTLTARCKLIPFIHPDKSRLSPGSLQTRTLWIYAEKIKYSFFGTANQSQQATIELNKFLYSTVWPTFESLLFHYNRKLLVIVVLCLVIPSWLYWGSHIRDHREHLQKRGWVKPSSKGKKTTPQNWFLPLGLPWFSSSHYTYNNIPQPPLRFNAD